jgi:hypothetical protein
MELVLIVTAGGLIGTAIRYILPGRNFHGLAVMPAAGVIVGALVWLVVVWFGGPVDAWWSWVITLGVTTMATIFLALELPKRRAAADERLRQELVSSPR